MDYVNYLVAQFNYWKEYSNTWRWYSNETFFSAWYTPFVTSFIYLVIIWALQAFMKNREPIKPWRIMLIHNIFLCAGSAIMFAGMLHELIIIGLRDGLYALYCDSMKQFNSRLCWWTYIFLFSKVYEFLDTIFLVLKKKHIQFLHIYHHAITLYVVWVCLDHKAPYGWILEITNSFIHIFMYLYYTLATFNIQPWWKRYLTMFQIIQFVLDLTGITAWAVGVYFLGYKCDGTFYSFFLTGFVLITFLILFLQFYFRSYKASQQRRREAAAAKKKSS
eukprot:TRINITY_DN0_c0_g1_i1.p1 TRINITY_DN0_c0_g1~~TRINITY_DN0_c0_g1_i1.p1  ORF type:complete len:276 (+),score=62.92 TRINITY_DN0_c0_g1_i1:126-953(+)